MIKVKNHYSPHPRFEVKEDTDGAASNWMSYLPAVRSIPAGEGGDINKVIIKADRIELVNGRVRVCLPQIDENGEMSSADDIKSEGYREIWVPSETTKSKLQSAGFKNVAVMPYPVTKPHWDVKDIDLPSDKFVVMIRHDMNVNFDRQNTSAALQAFQKAFPAERDVRLVCYIVNVDQSDDYRSLVSTFAGDDRVCLVEDDPSESRYFSFLHRAHCFMSIHKDMAFGYALAEAMSLGKYVIASTNGGNASYMNGENSFLIHEGSRAAMISRASKSLVEIYGNLDLIGTKTKRARLDIQKHLSPTSVGYKLQQRFSEVVDCSRNPIVLFYLKNKRKLIRRIEKSTRKIADKHYRHQVDSVRLIFLKKYPRPAVLE
jgi:glycosyltransferase involved in cell wall biosynthesis